MKKLLLLTFTLVTLLASNNLQCMETKNERIGNRTLTNDEQGLLDLYVDRYLITALFIHKNTNPFNKALKTKLDSLDNECDFFIKNIQIVFPEYTEDQFKLLENEAFKRATEKFLYLINIKNLKTT